MKEHDCAVYLIICVLVMEVAPNFEYSVDQVDAIDNLQEAIQPAKDAVGDLEKLIRLTCLENCIVEVSHRDNEEDWHDHT
jgi:hypothetical protein